MTDRQNKKSTTPGLRAGSQEHVSIWEAINEYVQACGGDPSKATVSGRRMNAVVKVETAIAAPFVALVENHRREIRQLERDACEEMRDVAAEAKWAAREEYEGY